MHGSSKKREIAAYDNAWKDILNKYLRQALEICFPELYQLIDWNKQWQPLDKEFNAITRESITGTLHADKLVCVCLKDGTEAWILILIEIQHTKAHDFPERIFLYSFRSYDIYRQPIVTCAILSDPDIKWRPSHYAVGLAGSGLRLDFLPCKLLDFEQHRNSLEQSDNPFALVILCQLDAIKFRRKNSSIRLKFKISLTRKLYERNYSREEILDLFRFIDFSIALPEDLALQYRDVVHQIEVKRNMVYISSLEKMSMDEGMQKGIQKGIQEGIQKGIQEGMQEGIQKGIQKGMQKGEQKGVSKVAKKMLLMGMQVAIVASATGLDIATVVKLKDKLQQKKDT